MLLRVIWLIKTIICKLKFGKGLSLRRIARLDLGSQIKIKDGKISIGENTWLRRGVYFAAVNGGQIAVGKNVSINRNSMVICHESVIIEDGCSLGPNVFVYDHDHCFGTEGLMKGFKTAPVVIGRNSWLGAGVIVLRGTRIGEGCVIGAGTVVRGEIPPHSIVTSDRSLYIRPIEDR